MFLTGGMYQLGNAVDQLANESWLEPLEIESELYRLATRS